MVCILPNYDFGIRNKPLAKSIIVIFRGCHESHLNKYSYLRNYSCESGVFFAMDGLDVNIDIVCDSDENVFWNQQ